MIGLVLIFALHNWWWAPLAYFVALLLMGIVYHDNKVSNFSGIYGIPLCLIILHTAFTIGLFDGLTRSGKAPSDRT